MKIEEKIPLHQAIKDDLLKKIETGYYKEGDKIPKEMDLTRKYNVSRPTIRQAISSLADEGYVERIKRKGTFVLKKKINQEFTHVISSFDTEIAQKGLIPKTKVLVFEEIDAPKKAAKFLGIEENDKVYKLVRLRYAGKDPIVFVTTFIPKNVFPDLIQIDFTSKRLYQSFLDFGKPIKRATRILDAIKADETTSALLAINEGDPVFYFQTIGYSDKNEIIEYSISKYRSDLNSFSFELDTFVE